MLLVALLLGAGFLEVLSVSSPLNVVRICQGETTNLLCPVNRELTIYSASYGRFVSGQESCPHKSVKHLSGSHLADLNCLSDVTALLGRRCDGLQACAVRASNRNFGDPCRGIYKHLDIEFKCDPTPGPTTPMPAPTTSESYKLNRDREFATCLTRYTRIFESAPHKECEALQVYIDCLKQVELRDPAAAPDIEQVMPRLRECQSTPAPKMIMLCKHERYEDCINITEAISDLQDFDNEVNSMKVFGGNWLLYTEKNFAGKEVPVKSGFSSSWLGVYTPSEGEQFMPLFSNQLSSLKPLEDQVFDYDSTDSTMMPTTSDYNPITNEFGGVSYSYSESGRPYLTTNGPDPTETGYSSIWVNLDDISSSSHPDMCRSTHCLLGIRVFYDALHNIDLPEDKVVSEMITAKLRRVYQILPEQLLLARVEKKSSEIILEITDMKGYEKRVIDIAVRIEDHIKHEEFTFLVGETLLIPDSDRYGVMLKSLPDEWLPKIKTRPPVDMTSEPYQTDGVTVETEFPTTQDNHVETDEPGVTVNNNDYGMKGDVKDIIIMEAESGGIPSKYFYPLLCVAVLLFIIACVVVSTVVYRCSVNKDYTLIKKVPSNIYIEVDSCSEKKIEGFENPSYLLEEVDHM